MTSFGQFACPLGCPSVWPREKGNAMRSIDRAAAASSLISTIPDNSSWGYIIRTPVAPKLEVAELFSANELRKLDLCLTGDCGHNIEAHGTVLDAEIEWPFSDCAD